MSHAVSRGTPPPPPEAAGAFGAQLPLAERYAAWLAGAGIERGLLGPREVPRLWDRHLLNCAALADLMPQGARVADVGSGAGLPGVVLAIARPDLHLTLVEPLLRRTTFLREAVDELGLAPRVAVVRGRAEDLHGQLRFDVVTSRAVANLGTLLTWCLPLTEEDGAVVALKGRRAQEEIDEAGKVLRRLRCAAPEVVVIEKDWLSSPVTAVRVEGGTPRR
jgi:16S rRNA (guanine527-N7)-methyltransferase